MLYIGRMVVQYILIGILLVGMVVLMVVQGRRQKKAQDDYLAMLDTLRVGIKVKMASGLLGRIKEIREEAPGFKTVVIETGDPKNPVLMTFVLEAVQGIVNEEAISQLNLQKAAAQVEPKETQPKEAETKINGEPVDASADKPAKKSTKKRK